MKIGILGCGSIANALTDFKLDGKLDVELSIFYDLKEDSANKLANKVGASATTSIDQLIDNSDLVLEAASQQAVKSLIPDILSAGRDVMIMSVGSLMDEEFREKLISIAKENNAKIHIPTGAIAGIDTVNASRLGDVESVSLVTRKPPVSLGIDLEDEEEQILFDGLASDAVKEYPKNINVSSTLSLASGIDVPVKIIADPKIDKNTHEIHLEGSFGQMVTKTFNTSTPENPKTSVLAAYSVASLLNKLSKTLQIGS
ncbi:MAG: aspartate dehydrogenase [Methanosphaera sp.]|nr:aspartate dehydrogenase [Methanosphaera sp.]